jgi:hypothetical protein
MDISRRLLAIAVLAGVAATAAVGCTKDAPATAPSPGGRTPARATYAHS